ncbi:MAG: bifunctional UDP-N-acetylmuramoyl-tripeptide:D-alanyl-D-alanine ligase/alanine racemase [Bacteroides sp.]|nr:bifunctional UDP-N-acetylmuramoyl-tripeptide:D-alanyl-D-alanine ligase/alanine racemase [Bacteroides sp.]
MTLEEIASRLGATIPPESRSLRVDTLLTDSRSLLEPEGTLFFAIPTKTNTGARYMRALYDRGVRMFVATELPDDMADASDAAVIIHPDPVAALQTITRRRADDRCLLTAIAGSRGKTTVKEWLYQLLEPVYDVARSPRSYNSQIGVPLSMWEIDPEHTDLAFIEAGVSRKGEMERLRECIRPDVVILTDIDSEHADGFGSLEEKIGEKVSLAADAQGIIYCSDSKEVAVAVGKLPASVHRTDWSMNPESGARLRITGVDSVSPHGQTGEKGTRIDYLFEGFKGSVELSFSASETDVRNAALALAYMLASGYSEELTARRMRHIRPVETRLSVSDGGHGCQVIHDSYTSDLSSLAPALDFMSRRRIPGQKPVVIISDLLHESADESATYGRMARLLRLAGIDTVIGVGPHISAHSDLFGGNALFFPDVDTLLTHLRRNPMADSIILLKGSADFDLTPVKETLEVRSHETILEVNLDAIITNYNYFKSALPSSTGMIAMVKASGYGAGSYEIAKTLQDAGAAYLAVAVLDEGLDLRRQGITMPIMVMNPRVADYREMFRYRLEPEIYSPAMLDDVIAQARRYGVTGYPIHIKLDTGMHRMGYIEPELPALMDRMDSTEEVRIATVFSHLATADMPDMNDYTLMQLDTFERCSAYILSRSAYPVRRHVLNSAGILRFPEHHYDFARLGIGLYGVNTLPPEMEKPLAVVSSLKTVIIHLRHWPAGSSVGYAGRGRLDRDSVIATIPIGYADGMNRHFGNGRISVLVNGKEAPTVGNICMDACMIDVTGIPCREGDRVEIFGEAMPVSRLSDALDTIPYEILTSVSPRVKRVYFRE